MPFGCLLLYRARRCESTASSPLIKELKGVLSPRRHLYEGQRQPRPLIALMEPYFFEGPITIPPACRRISILHTRQITASHTHTHTHTQTTARATRGKHTHIFYCSQLFGYKIQLSGPLCCIHLLQAGENEMNLP